MLNLTTEPSRDGGFRFVCLDGRRTNWRVKSYVASSGRELWYAERFGHVYFPQLPSESRVLNCIEKSICRALSHGEKRGEI